MDREEIKSNIEEIMREYDEEEIDGDTYMEKMLDFTLSPHDDNDEDQDNNDN